MAEAIGIGSEWTCALPLCHWGLVIPSQLVLYTQSELAQDKLRQNELSRLTQSIDTHAPTLCTFFAFFAFLLQFYSIFPIWFDLFSQIFDFHSHFGTATSSHVHHMLTIASDQPIKWVDPEHYNHHPVPTHPWINYQIWIATFTIGQAFILTLPFTLFIVFPIDFRLPISSFLCFKFFHLPNLVLKFLYIKHDLSYQ